LRHVSWQIDPIHEQESIHMIFRGLDHVVFTTSNMQRAVAFYNGLLGMPIIHAMEYEDLNEDGSISSPAQHFYFGVGGDNPEAHIAIFAFKNLAHGSGVATDPRQPGAFLHFNLRVDADKIEEYCAQLSKAEYPFTQITRYNLDPNNLPTRESQIKHQRTWRVKTTINEYHAPEADCLMNSVFITDPDGVKLEFNAWSELWHGAWPPEAVTPWGETFPAGPLVDQLAR
jgi:catechol 2,3-dioxygenase-like lactoylglutathione lyase family enzyme